MKNGIPFDVAFAVDGNKRTGWAIVFSEFESGKRFNWNLWQFDKDRDHDD